MSKLNTVQKAIINSLTFTEPFETLVEEVQAPEPVIADELKTLIDKRLVQVMEELDGKMRKSFYYDSDNMRSFNYQATAKGLESV